MQRNTTALGLTLCAAALVLVLAALSVADAKHITSSISWRGDEFFNVQGSKKRGGIHSINKFQLNLDFELDVTCRFKLGQGVTLPSSAKLSVMVKKDSPPTSLRFDYRAEYSTEAGSAKLEIADPPVGVYYASVLSSMDLSQQIDLTKLEVECDSDMADEAETEDLGRHVTDLGFFDSSRRTIESRQQSVGGGQFHYYRVVLGGRSPFQYDTWEVPSFTVKVTSADNSKVKLLAGKGVYPSLESSLPVEENTFTVEPVGHQYYVFLVHNNDQQSAPLDYTITFDSEACRPDRVGPSCNIYLRQLELETPSGHDLTEARHFFEVDGDDTMFTRAFHLTGIEKFAQGRRNEQGLLRVVVMQVSGPKAEQVRIDLGDDYFPTADSSVETGFNQVKLASPCIHCQWKVRLTFPEIAKGSGNHRYVLYASYSKTPNNPDLDAE